MTYDAGDPSSVDSRILKEKLGRETHEEYLRKTVSTYEGRATLWNIMAICGINDKGYHDGSYAQYVQGRRDIGLVIKDDVEHVAPGRFVLMMEEATERDNRNQ